MNAADSEYLVTCDGYYRRGDALDHISKANEGLAGVEHEVSDVVVVDRLGDALTHSLADNQHDYDELVAEHAGASVEPVSRDAEDMLFLMYTSGTTGEPKGVKHTTGGYLSYAAWTSHSVLDIKPEDTYWCSADIGWITGCNRSQTPTPQRSACPPTRTSSRLSRGCATCRPRLEAA